VCPVRISPAPFQVARWIERDAATLVPTRRGVLVVSDNAGRHLVLFANRYALEGAQQDHPALELLTEPPEAP